MERSYLECKDANHLKSLVVSPPSNARGQTKRYYGAKIGNSASFPVYFLDVVNESENIQGAHNKKAPAKPQLCDSASRCQPRAPGSQHALADHLPSQHWTPLPCG
jgi:hypothetical protein